MNLNLSAPSTTPLYLFPAFAAGIRLATAERFCGKTARIVEIESGVTLPLRPMTGQMELMVLRGEGEIQLGERTVLLASHQRCSLPSNTSVDIKASTDLRIILVSEEIVSSTTHRELLAPRENDMDIKRC